MPDITSTLASVEYAHSCTIKTILVRHLGAVSVPSQEKFPAQVVRDRGDGLSGQIIGRAELGELLARNAGVGEDDCRSENREQSGDSQ